MTTVETTLHADYQINEWGLKEAIRELIANAIDGENRYRTEGRGQMSMTYDERQGLLTITNDNVSIPSSALLLGTSESRQDKKYIGQFGEGLPMALLVLARLGLSVTIYNGKEKWTPLVQRSVKFRERVLAIKTRKMITERQHFSVQVQGITPDEMQEIRKLFLKLDPNLDRDWTVRPDPFDDNMVLLQPEYKGRIYSKGVFIQQRDDMVYGYNVAVTLNRDRHMVDDYSLRSAVDQLLMDAVDKAPTMFREQLFEALSSDKDQVETSNRYSSLAYRQSFCDACYQWWQDTYGQAYAVESFEEYQKAQTLGVQAVIVSPLLVNIIGKYAGSLDTVAKSQASALVATHDLDTVPFAVGKRFRLFQKATTELLPSWNGRVRLVTMADATLDFAYREATGTLDISLRAFTDPEQALPVWCRGMLQVSSIDWHGITYQNRTLALAGKIYAVSQEEGA